MRIEGVVALVTDEFADVQQTPAAPCLQLVDAFAPVLAAMAAARWSMSSRCRARARRGTRAIRMLDRGPRTGH